MKNNLGWISLHRKLLDNPVFSDSKLLHLFIFCLLKANNETKEFIFNGSITHVERGSFITGLNKLSDILNMPKSTIYRRLKTLEKLGIIKMKMENKFTRVSIIKYSSYQPNEKSSGTQTENKWKTNGKQVETNNNDNNDNKKEEEQKLPAKKHAGDFLEIIVGNFKELYLRHMGVPYLSFGAGGKSSGKDRIAAGHLARVVKKIYPNDNSEEALIRLNNLFETCFATDDEWLKNNISLSLIYSKLNQFIQYAKKSKDNAKPKGFDSRKNSWIPGTN